MMVSKAQFSKQIQDAIKNLQQRERTWVEALHDDTRVYEYGARVNMGLWDSALPITNAMRDWCNDTYGPKPYGEYYGDRWQVSNNTFWFKNERDRTLFLVRWSSSDLTKT